MKLYTIYSHLIVLSKSTGFAANYQSTLKRDYSRRHGQIGLAIVACTGLDHVHIDNRARRRLDLGLRVSMLSIEADLASGSSIAKPFWRQNSDCSDVLGPAFR